MRSYSPAPCCRSQSVEGKVIYIFHLLAVRAEDELAPVALLLLRIGAGARGRNTIPKDRGNATLPEGNLGEDNRGEA